MFPDTSIGMKIVDPPDQWGGAHEYLENHERILTLQLRVTRVKQNLGISKGVDDCSETRFKNLIGTPEEYVEFIKNHKVTPTQKHFDLLRVCEEELLLDLKFWEREALCHQNALREARECKGVP